MYIILHEIQDTSEQTLESLLTYLKGFKLSTVPGEDVGQAVNLVKSTSRILGNASHKYRNYLPTDFSKIVLDVFQTTSVPEFNKKFSELEDAVISEADMHGTRPKWPSISAILTLATNSYRRMKVTKQWDVATTGNGTQAGLTGTPKPGPHPRTQLQQDPFPGKKQYKCFNCDKVGCNPRICKAPRDEAKIERNRKAFMDAKSRKTDPKKNSQKQGKQRAYKTSPDGTPLKLNKKGDYVVDMRAKHIAMKAVAATKAALTSTAHDASSAPSAPTATPTPPPAPATATPSARDFYTAILSHSE